VSTPTRVEVVRALAEAGCVAPRAEADELLAAAADGVGAVRDLLARRAAGEPLPWITGRATFCGIGIRIDPGVFVPREHTEALASRAAELLSDDGVAADLCTGSGAVAVVLRTAHPTARILATDVDPNAVACARRNGVDASIGDLDGPIAASWRGRVDVVTAVVPYVPSEALHLLPRDVRRYEPRRALDGGAGGIELLVRAAESSARLLRAGGTVLLELGGDQASAITPVLARLGFERVRVHADDEGMDRAIEARRG
jgi:release factor glutamine methyltransferase